MSHSKADIVQIYSDLKAQAGGIPPSRQDFLTNSGIGLGELEEAFGASPYSKLQELAGDSPNRLKMERTPLDEIMSAYGDLGSEVFKAEGRMPVGPDWKQRGLRPGVSGLKKVHGITFPDFPRKFLAHCAANRALAVKHADFVDFIRESEEASSTVAVDAHARLVQSVCSQIRAWSPAMRRNSEEAYKSELSLHLRSENAGLEIREERGESQCDIAVGSEIAIELKKSPTQAEYDRCFGQIARHLQGCKSAIALLLDVPRRDAFEDFTQLVDRYFSGRVTVIRNG